MRTEAVRGRRTCKTMRARPHALSFARWGTASTSTAKLCASTSTLSRVRVKRGQSDVACRLQCCCADFVVWEDDRASRDRSAVLPRLSPAARTGHRAHPPRRVACSTGQADIRERTYTSKMLLRTQSANPAYTRGHQPPAPRRMIKSSLRVSPLRLTCITQSATDHLKHEHDR